ncbi:hypothetical protein PY365_12480 [Roseiarcaceae bacterium H3SJ34-1]|nr:hypothetical protein [Roseiarcaceae bacterium H3SJ34-1]
MKATADAQQIALPFVALCNSKDKLLVDLGKVDFSDDITSLALIAR